MQIKGLLWITALFFFILFVVLRIAYTIYNTMEIKILGTGCANLYGKQLPQPDGAWLPSIVWPEFRSIFGWNQAGRESISHGCRSYARSRHRHQSSHTNISRRVHASSLTINPLIIMMAVVGLSLPEATLLKKVMTWRLWRDHTVYHLLRLPVQHRLIKVPSF